MSDELTAITPAVRLPFARTPSGAVRWARDRRRDEACVCFGCGAPVVLRAGELRRAHYAHASDAPCRAETVLHRATIALLAGEIEAASAARRPLRAPAVCRDCDLVQPRDLARIPALSALCERTVTSRRGRSARPDLVVVRRGERRPLYAIEVVVTHAPEEEARDVWASLGLPVVIVRPSWAALATLERPLREVRELGDVTIEGAPCAGWRHPPARGAPCGGCGRRGVVSTVQRWKGEPCWRCGRRVPYADVRLHDVAADLGEGWDGQPLATALTLGRALIPRAATLGVSLGERWIYRTGRPEIVHACPECGSTQARPGRGGEREPERVLAASWCARCATLEPLGAPRARVDSPLAPTAARGERGGTFRGPPRLGSTRSRPGISPSRAHSSSDTSAKSS